MNFTMKLLAVSILVVAMMALNVGNAYAQEVASPEKEATNEEKEVDSPTESTLDKQAEQPDSKPEEEKEEDEEEEEEEEGEEKKHEVAKRSICCPGGWSRYGRQCVRYFSSARTWAVAQRICQLNGGNLASVHSRGQEYWLRRLAGNRVTWVGLSDAQQDRYWFWIDGSRFNFAGWCSGEPNNFGGRQSCLRINWGGRKCWDDGKCSDRHGFICVRRAR